MNQKGNFNFHNDCNGGKSSIQTDHSGNLERNGKNVLTGMARQVQDVFQTTELRCLSGENKTKGKKET